jgi:hypothetical protein
MSASARPFDWKASVPERTLPHPLSEELTQALSRSEVRLIYAGRGMGKSVLVHQVVANLRRREISCAHVKEGADAPSLRQALLGAVTASGDESKSLREVLARRLDEHGTLVILVDEVDAWLRDGRRDQSRDLLNALGSLQRGEFARRLGILVAGGVAPLQLFANPLGSPFSSRVDKTHYLRPFSRSEILKWARPLTEREPCFGEDWLDALRVASGGVPLLVAAALGAAWDAVVEGCPGVIRDPVSWLDGFIREQDGYREAVRASVSPDGGGVALTLLDLIGEMDGELHISSLHNRKIDVYQAERIVKVLAATGLVAGDYDLDEEPWRVRAGSSLLRLRGPSQRVVELAPSAIEDLRLAARHLGRVAVDLWHGSGASRRIVPEATLSAFVVVHLINRGWRAEREAQRGPGRVDVLLTRVGLPGEVLVEVKIWGRNDYRSIGAQSASYAREDAEGIVCLMIADRPVTPEEYQLAVEGGGLLGEPDLAGEVAFWRSEHKQAGGRSIPFAHILVCLPRR